MTGELGRREWGLTTAEAAQARLRWGPNALQRPRTSGALHELVRQLVHPLALLLWMAAALALVTENGVLAVAIVLVLMINASFAFVQERQAQSAVEAIDKVVPLMATVLRDGVLTKLPALELVPGDAIVVEEGAKVPADARLVSGAVSVDMSLLTGESVPVERAAAEAPRPPEPPLTAEDVILSGTAVVAGDATAVVFATGAGSQIGQIADLTARVRSDRSPLEVQVTAVAWVISAIAVGVAAVFIPTGVATGLGWHASIVFAIGLLIANVPEGLLPTITLALAGGVRRLARRGAIVKRLSAVETLGSTSVICTDKTGTLTQNRMAVRRVWPSSTPALAAAQQVMGWCHALHRQGEALAGDPMEIALYEHAAEDVPDLVDQSGQVLRRFRFDPELRRMSVVKAADGPRLLLCKGAVESVLPRCEAMVDPDGVRPLDAAARTRVLAAAEQMAGQGLRVLALADRIVGEQDRTREQYESGMRLVGLVGLLDPPRPSAAAAVATCHAAGIRIHVITGDALATARAVAAEVGIAADELVDCRDLASRDDQELRELVSKAEVVFARASPADKLRIASAVHASGHVLAMTGDGVNDAPALRRADIGIAMGGSGTDVAREAATMVITDDDFATIVAAVEYGRQVYANIRKFILYVFAHATPEVLPFLLFALSGGSVPLGLTGMQILAIDLGTETLPALALGREPPEPGAMDEPPRPRSARIIDRSLMLRAWLVLGGVSALLCTGAFLWHLGQAGWTWGADTSEGSALHGAYVEATTLTFLGIVLCQIGTAFAARTETASLRSVGLLTNRPLLWGIAFELAVAAAVVYLPPLQAVFDTAPVEAVDVLPLLSFPVIVWGTDEVRRAAGRRRAASRPAEPLRSGRDQDEGAGDRAGA